MIVFAIIRQILISLAILALNFGGQNTITDTSIELNLPKIGQAEAVSAAELPEISTSPALKGTATTPVMATYTAAQQDRIEVAGNVIPLYYYSGDVTGVSPAAGTAYYATQFNLIFGHNSYDVFGGLANLGIGQTFTVVTGGETAVYQITNGYYVNQTLRKSYPFGGNKIMLITCAPGVTNGATDSSRYVIEAARI